MTIAIATFAVVLGLILGVYWAVWLRPEQDDKRALRKRLKVSRPGTVRQQDLLRPVETLSRIRALDRALGHSTVLVEPIRRDIAISGMNITVGGVVLACIFAGTATFATLLIATRLFWVSALAALFMSAVPVLLLKFKASRRLAAFEEQFPEAMDLIARALRAGHAFTTGLAMVADEMPNAIGAEFRLVHDRQSYGMPLPEALRDLARRVPLLDARFFVTAVLTQRESGGNLAEILDNLAALMRERFKVKRQVRVVSAHGRITGWVLAGLAPAIAAVLIVIAPEHIGVMIRDPLGIQITIGAVALQLIGVFIIRRIINVEV
jgi:tight adherence protein B